MTGTGGDTPWLVRIGGARSPIRVRLFAVPYAGGGPLTFREWGKAVPAGVEVVAVQLPGRERRLTERPLDDVKAVMDALFVEILPWMECPFALFGHSLGAMLCFETARRLHSGGHASPAHLFVSGFRAPHLPNHRQMVSSLNYWAFTTELRRLGGTPPAVLDNEELMQLILPTLRADFRLVETYGYIPSEPLHCPITAFAGSEDQEATPPTMEPWKQHTTREFKLHELSGRHFFLHTQRASILAVVNKRLGELLENGQ